MIHLSNSITIRVASWAPTSIFVSFFVIWRCVTKKYETKTMIENERELNDTLALSTRKLHTMQNEPTRIRVTNSPYEIASDATCWILICAFGKWPRRKGVFGEISINKFIRGRYIVRRMKVLPCHVRNVTRTLKTWGMRAPYTRGVFVVTCPVCSSANPWPEPQLLAQPRSGYGYSGPM